MAGTLSQQPSPAFSADRNRRRSRLVSGTDNTNKSGDAEVIITADAERYLEAVTAWFQDPEEGDRIINVEIFDDAGTPVRQLTLNDLTGASRGWRIPLAHPIFYLPQLFHKKEKRKVQANWTVHITGKKNTAASGKTLYANLEWSLT